MTDRPRSAPTDLARLQRSLLRAMALGAASGSIGCGGNVVFVDDGDDGGGGRTGSSNQVTTSSVGPSTGSGSFTCDVSPEVGINLSYVCLPFFDFCPDASSEEVLYAAQSEVDTWGGCGDCCTYWARSVPCGPDPEGDGCCYYVEVTEQPACEGRPFRIDGAPVLASVEERSDWSREVDVACSDVDPVALRALAEAWLLSARAEHASVASFARSTLELLALGAPSELVLMSQRAMGDEILHAELCFGIASRLAHSPKGPGALPIRGALARDLDPVAIAVSTAVEGCVNETLAAALALHERDVASDPAVRSALERIADDEARHAELAWRTVAWMIAMFGEPVRAAVLAAIDGAAPFGVDGDALRGVPDDVARAFGRLPAAQARAVLARTLDEVVRPSARELAAKCLPAAGNASAFVS